MDIKLSIHRIIIEFTKVSMDFWNSYFSDNVMLVFNTYPKIGKYGFKYRMNLEMSSNGAKADVKYQPYHEGKQKAYSLWVEINPKYLDDFKFMLDELACEAREVNFVLCDVAFDIPVGMRNVFIDSNYGRNMNLYEGTRYYGKRGDSNKHGYCRIYDKAIEQKEKHNIDMGGQLTRVEMVYKPDSSDRFTMLELYSRPPKFNRLYSYRVLDSPLEMKPQKRAVILAVQAGLISLKEFKRDYKKGLLSDLENQLHIDFDQLAIEQWAEVITPVLVPIYELRKLEF